MDAFLEISSKIAPGSSIEKVSAGEHNQYLCEDLKRDVDSSSYPSVQYSLTELPDANKGLLQYLLKLICFGLPMSYDNHIFGIYRH